MRSPIARWFACALWLILAGTVSAHEVRPAYLEITVTGEESFDVLWKVPTQYGGRVGIYVTMPEQTVERDNRRGAFLGDAFVERWSGHRPGGLSDEAITFSGLDATNVDVIVRIQHPNGAVQSARVFPGEPSVIVESAPSRWGVASTYLIIGVEHILFGIDHLLFVLALVVLVNGWWRLIHTITAFTLAHSMTLSLAALGMLSVPGPPVEACIALSIVFVAAEIVRGFVTSTPGLTARRPWIVALTFGLLHGLGFAGALSDVGLPQHAIPMALLFFNVGVEVGQLIFIAAILAVAAAMRRVPGGTPNWGRYLVPYTIGPIAMFWVIERTLGFMS